MDTKGKKETLKCFFAPFVVFFGPFVVPFVLKRLRVGSGWLSYLGNPTAANSNSLPSDLNSLP